MSFIAGMALMLFGMRYQPLTWRLHITGATFAAAAMTFYASWLVSILREHNAEIVHDFVVLALLGYTAFAMLFVGGFKTLNGAADGKAAAPFEGRILSVDSGRNEVRVLIPLADRTGIVSFSLDPVEFARVSRAQSMKVLLHPGAIGEPWVARTP